jgi:hypothetical protein
MYGRHSCGGLPGVVFVSSGEYDIAKVRLRFEARRENVGSATYGKAKLSGPADENPHDGGSRGELYKCLYADDPDVVVSIYASGAADSY